MQIDVDWYVNVIFTTLVFDFLLFCTFLNHICPEQICINLILRDKNQIARQKRIKDLTQIKHRLQSGLLYVCLPKQRDEVACYSCLLLFSLREELKASLKVTKSHKHHSLKPINFEPTLTAIILSHRELNSQSILCGIYSQNKIVEIIFRYTFTASRVINQIIFKSSAIA